MSAAIQIDITAGPEAWVVTLDGTIDQTLGHHPLTDQLASCREPVVFDLDRVHRITCAGIRDWAAMLRTMRSAPYYFIRLRPALVLELGTVTGFAQRGQLVSLYCPFRCPRCGTGIELPLDLRHQYRAAVTASLPPVLCPECHLEAELDHDPASYFAFHASQPPPVVLPAVDRVIDGLLGLLSLHTAPPPALRIEKEVDAAVTVLTLSGTLDRAARFERLAAGLEGPVLLQAGAVTMVTAEGVAQLGVLLEAPGFELYLSRLSLPLVRALTRLGPPIARILSVSLPFQCSSCQSEHLRTVGIGLQAALGRGTLEEPCRVCGNKLRPSFDRQDQNLVTRLRMRAPPREIEEHLGRRRARPTADLEAARPAAASPPQTPGPGPARSPSGGAVPPTPVSLARYELVERIGVGGMAEVYLGRQVGPEGFAKTVVVKRILPNLLADRRFVNMLLEEARLAARISHSNVVQIFDLARAGDDYFVVMEYVRGWNLDFILKHLGRQSRPMPIAIACRIVSDLCAGLWAAHSAVDEAGRPLSIVHRDVSPHNVLISDDGLVKLTDFGVAKAADSMVATKVGALKGKVLYLAPETVRGERPDARADVFAAGLVLYCCLALRHPFEGFSDFQVYSTLLTTPIPVPDVRQARSDAPAALRRIVARAVSRSKESRYTNTQEMRLELESFMTEAREHATPEHLSFFLAEVFRRADEGTSSAVRGPAGSDRDQDASAPAGPELPSSPTGEAFPVTSESLVGEMTEGGLTEGGLTVGGLTVGLMGLGNPSTGEVTVGNLTEIAGLTTGGPITAGELNVGHLAGDRHVEVEDAGTAVHGPAWFSGATPMPVGPDAGSGFESLRGPHLGEPGSPSSEDGVEELTFGLEEPTRAGWSPGRRR